MPRPRRQDERRAELVDAAIRAGSERGLRALSLSDVADRAGLTRGAILYYYDDLDELLIEAHRAGIERFCDHRDAVLAGIDDPGEQLAAAIREGLPSGPDDALLRLLYEFDVLAGTSRLHDELVTRMYGRQLATYRGVIERGVAAGCFTPVVAESTLAMTLVALEDAYGLHIVAGNSEMTVDVAREAMLEAAAGLGAPAAVRDSAHAHPHSEGAP